VYFIIPLLQADEQFPILIYLRWGGIQMQAENHFALAPDYPGNMISLVQEVSFAG
jgi:hypothetical protein